MKKLFALIVCVMFLLCPLMTACEITPAAPKPQQKQLSSPEIAIQENSITWQAVDNADGYEVYKNGELAETVTNPSYTVSETAPGSYAFYVVAISNNAEKFKTSEKSNEVTYTVEDKKPEGPQDPVDNNSKTLDAQHKIYVVGDSTVCDYSAKPDNYYLQRYGYGTQLYNYLNLAEEGAQSSQIVNLALSGRSSLSFLSEDNYKTLVSSIKEGDYLIIGFGHNDEKSDDPLRFTDPSIAYTTEKTAKAQGFSYTLYNYYVKVATDKGATPVLCTPIVRYNEKGVYEKVSYSHVTADGDYPEAIRTLAKDTGTALVDLTKITAEYYTANNAQAKNLHAHTTYKGEKPNETPDGMDGTHINMYGAKTIAYWLLNNLPEDCTLKNFVYTAKEASAPSYENDYAAAINAGYVRPDYTPFNPEDYPSNKIATTVSGETSVDWYKTAMGVLGGATKPANYAISYSDGVFTVNSDAGSKFASSQDGFGAAFVQIEVSKNFTCTAKVTVKELKKSLDNQMGFGMMLRDDILIDVEDKTLVSNFVAAGVLKNGAIFSRDSKTALNYSSNSMEITAGAEYQLEIKRVGQVVEVKIVKGATEYTKTYTDFSFVGVDNNYMYLCLFANRGIVAEFSDVNFVYTGEAQGA